MADQTGSGALRAVVEPVVASLGLELVDVKVVGAGRSRTLRVTVDHPEVVDLDTLAAANRPVLDALDTAAVLEGPYALEMSSPGLERPLRRPGEFRRFLGTTIALKTHEVVSGARRHRGALVEADDEGIALEVDGQRRRFPYGGIAQARTVFEWGPPPKPGGPGKRAASRQVTAGPPATGSHSEERLA